MPRPSPNPLFEQKQRLAAEQARIARELAAMEKLARQKPKPVRPTLEPERRLKVTTTPSRLLPPRPEAHLFPQGRARSTKGKRTRRRKTEARLEQVKFLLLCILFAAVILFVWKNFPG